MEQFICLEEMLVAAADRQVERREHRRIEETGGTFEVGDVEMHVVDQAAGMELHGIAPCELEQKKNFGDRMSIGSVTKRPDAGLRPASRLMPLLKSLFDS